MSLTDGHLAALADQAAALIEPSPTVQIVPDAGDDPYRWGSHSWTVRFRTEDGDEAAVGVNAEEEPGPVLQKFTKALAELDVVLHRPDTGEVVDRIEPEQPT